MAYFMANTVYQTITISFRIVSIFINVSYDCLLLKMESHQINHFAVI